MKASTIGYNACSCTHPCLTPPLGGSHQNFWMKLILQKLEGWGYCTVKIAWPFSTDPPVWRTDGFAIAYSALIMLSRAKKLTRCRNWCWCLYRRQYVQLTWGNGNEYCISFVIQFSCSVHANNTRTCRYPGNCIHICALGLDELYVSYRYVLHADCCW